jgi:hypothetical protein
MTLRTPIVMVNGQFQQLQSGDSIALPQNSVPYVSLTNGETAPIVIGTPVYVQAAGTVKKAKADAAATADAIGLVMDTSITNAVAGLIQTEGIVTATTTQWDAVAGTTGGLTFGTRYYLSDATAGLLTATPPSTSTHFSLPLGIALNTTELKLNVPGVGAVEL